MLLISIFLSSCALCLSRVVGSNLKANYASCEDACNALRHMNSAGKEYHADFQQQPLAVLDSDVSKVQSLFWAQQQSSIKPACYVRAGSQDDVAAVISVSRSSGCPFSIRGGGHSDIKGASNSPGAITLDLAGLDEVEVVEADKTARIGAGLTWGAVYRELEKRNLTVVGGRLTSVGVGGLTLGGGLSHFSGMHGWACDNVKTYEIVLANGTVIEASVSAHPDLYRALRGGGNNFGVITRFDLDIYQQGPMWGGLHVWPFLPQVTNTITTAFIDFAHAAPSDPHVSLFAGLGFKLGHFAWAAGLYDALGREEPPIFKDFVDDPDVFGAPKLLSTARLTMLSDLADELDRSEPAGMRSRFTTATFKANRELLVQMVEIFVQEVKRALEAGLGTDERFAPMLGIQPLTKSFVKASEKKGGNLMGLSEEDAPMIVCSFGWEWSRESDDEVVIRGIKAVHDHSVAWAKNNGFYHHFKYMNYAAEDQDPIGSYGSDSIELMRKVKQLYDTDGLFTALVPGGFKIP